MLKYLPSLACFSLWITMCFAKRGFILTAPKLIDAGSTEYFTFTAFDVPPGGVVSLKLLNYYTNIILAESEVNVLNNMNMWVEMEVPSIPAVSKAKLQVSGNFSDGYRIKAEKEVHIRHTSVLTFVQTDKPIYKPGQTVKFRILPMNSQLRPLETNTVGDVWIEDPSGIRVAQWRQVEFKEGMVQLELPLSNEPPLGLWNIKTIINEVNTAQSFEVDKYVLPKFEVKIKPPPIIMADDETIPVEICAWYTFGKKVDGKLKTRVSYKRMSWDSKEIPSVEQSGLISGCYNISVSTHALQMHTGQYHRRQLEFFAEVIENGTEIVVNETIAKNVMKSPLTIEFLGTEDADYFKPGIPFFGQVQVRKSDGEAAPSEKISICVYDRNRQRGDHPRWSPYGRSDDDNNRCQRYTTNKKGRFRFSIAPQPSTVTKLTLVAEALKHESQHYEGMSYLKKIEKPQATLTLSPWYSPSGNYLQIQSTPDEMECDKMHRVKVRYTGQKGASIKFYHKVISRGRIVQQGSHQRTFYSKDESLNRRYDFDALRNTGSNGRQYYPLRSSSSAAALVNNVTSMMPELGEFDLSFDPRATMSPVARLLIYYVREDGEVVADSRKFRIAKCLLNKVNLHFRHEQQYPSTEASLLLSATPSSVCGIGLVDKSVLLLKPEKQFNIEKIFDIMKGFDVDKSTKPLQVSDDYCSQKVDETDAFPSPPHIFDLEGARPERRLSPIRRARYLSRLESYHADTSMAFEEAGMVAITDFELETRPCQNREPIAFELSEISDRGRLARRRGGPRASASAYLPMASQAGMPVLPALKSAEPQPETPAIEEIRNYFPETWLWEMQTIGGSGETALRRKLPHTITQWTGRAVCVHPKTGLGISEDARIRAFQPFFVAFRLPYSIVRGEILPLVVSVFNYLTECLPIKLSLESSSDYKILSESGSHKVCVCGGQSASHKFVLKPTALRMVNVTVYGYSLEDDDEVCGNEITARLSARDAVSKQLKVEAEGIAKEEVTNYFICPKNTNGSYATEIDLIPPDDVVEGSARAFVAISADLMAPALNSLQELVNLPVGCGEQNMILFTPNIFVLDYLTATGEKTQDIENECIKNMKIGYQRELNYRHKDGSFSAFGERDKEGSLWLTSFVIKSFGQATRFIDIDMQDIQMSINWITENQFENGCYQPIGTLHHKDMKGGLTEGEHSLSPLTAYVLIALIESGMVRTDQDEAKNAIKCLREDTNPNMYALSLYAYACALMKQNVTALKYLKLLDERAFNVGGLRHWSSDVKSQKSKSVSVEIAGYYILARIEVEKEESTENVLPVVRWIAKQRNSKGGFISTQDTIIALQALARYASIQTKETVDLGLAVEADSLVKGFKLNEDNKLVTQKIQIPEVPTVVDLQAVGEGCALVQFTFRYNVERAVGSDAFDLNIDVVRVGSSECNLPRIGICMRYKIPNQTSNMVVVYIKMASGFTPDEESLNKLHTESNISLKRYEVEENVVHLYFDQLTNEQMCFAFYVRNELEVEDIKPATIMIQDYYTPELQVTKEYSIPSACSVPGLPELPRLPPLVINSDDESPTSGTDFDTFTPTSVPETETVEVTSANPTTFNDNHLMTIILNNTESTTTMPEVIDDTDHPNGETMTFGVVTVEAGSDLTPTDAEENSTVEAETLDSLNVELADDSFSLLMNENSSRFSNFIDVDHDLDVPDGIEGIIPVTVLPPKKTSSETSLDCPKCSTGYPENFEELYCTSAFVLKVRLVDANSVRIIQDISPVHSKPITVKKFASLNYDEECSCPLLMQRGGFLLIIGEDAALWDKEKDQQIHLKKGTQVIFTSSRTVQPNKLRSAKMACTDDP